MHRQESEAKECSTLREQQGKGPAARAVGIQGAKDGSGGLTTEIMNLDSVLAAGIL